MGLSFRRFSVRKTFTMYQHLEDTSITRRRGLPLIGLFQRHHQLAHFLNSTAVAEPEQCEHHEQLHKYSHNGESIQEQFGFLMLQLAATESQCEGCKRGQIPFVFCTVPQLITTTTVSGRLTLLDSDPQLNHITLITEVYDARK